MPEMMVCPGFPSSFLDAEPTDLPVQGGPRAMPLFLVALVFGLDGLRITAPGISSLSSVMIAARVAPGVSPVGRHAGHAGGDDIRPGFP